VTRPYDLAVAYRVYPGLSRNGFPGVRDKQALIAGCLRSFKEAIGELRVKVWVILDGCPESTAALFRAQFEKEDLVLVRMEKAGNARTFLEQVSLLSAQVDAEAVYLAEDDYVYVPGALGRMMKYLTTLPETSFLSGYDHPDAYRLPISMSHGELRIHEGHQWRSVVSTCLTFMTRRSTLKAVEPLLRTYGRRNYDSSIWQSLTKSNAKAFGLAPWRLRRDPLSFKVIAKAWWFGWRQILLGPQYTLWVPTPSLATHLEPNSLAPNVDWSAAFRELKIPGLPDGKSLSQHRV
jgi:hypothetical protein